MQYTGMQPNSGDNPLWKQLESMQDEVGELAYELEHAKNSNDINNVLNGRQVGTTQSKEGLTAVIYKLATKISDLNSRAAKIESSVAAASEPDNPQLDKVKKAFTDLHSYAASLQGQAEEKLHVYLRTEAAAMGALQARDTSKQKDVKMTSSKQSDVKLMDSSTSTKKGDKAVTTEPTNLVVANIKKVFIDSLSGVVKAVSDFRDKVVVSTKKPVETTPTVESYIEILQREFGIKPEEFKELLERHLGIPERNYKLDDINLILSFEAALLEKIQKGGPNVKDLQKVKQLIDEIKTEIKTAFHKGLELLNKQDFSKLTDMSTGKELDCVCACHDFFWDFENPLEPHIEMADFLMICDSMSPKLEEFLNIHKSDLNNNKLELLLDSSSQIASRAKRFEGLPPQEIDAAMKHKSQYLHDKMQKNRNQWSETNLKEAPNVVVLGGGPGGLMRLMAAGCQGANVKLFERRETYDRPMVLNIDDQPILHYFGIFQRLIANKSISAEDQSKIQIMHLEAACKQAAVDLLGDSAIITGESVDIQYGKLDKIGKPQTFCLIKNPGEKGSKSNFNDSTPYPADLIVDATGARGAAAKILGKSPPQTLENPRGMVVAVFKKSAQSDEKSAAALPAAAIPTVQSDDKAAAALSTETPTVRQKFSLDDYETMKFETPNVNYLQIQTLGVLQDRLLQLLDKIDKLKQRIEMLKSAQPRTLESDAKSKVATKTTSEEITIKALEADKNALSKELEKLSEDIGEAAAGDMDGFEGLKRLKFSPFLVQVAKRDAATQVGDALVMQSGDSLVTPDPRSGSGANTAITGSILFAKTLKDIGKGNSDENRASRYRDFVFGSSALADMVISSAKEKRGSDPEAFATLNFGLHELQKDLRFSKPLLDSLERVFLKHAYNQPLTAADKDTVKEFMKTWMVEGKNHQDTPWYKVFNAALEAIAKE